MNAKEKIKKRLPNVNHEDIDKLSTEQSDFIIHPLNKSCFLSACPGSGKTQVVGVKTAYEIADWKNQFSGIAVLSFTKRAAKEIANRVAKYDGINATRHPHFIGTIDSWLHSFILHPFGHSVSGFQGRDGDKSFQLIENESDADFLSNNSFSVTHKVDVKNKKGQALKQRDAQYNATNYTLSFNGDIETIKNNDAIPQNISQEHLKKIKQNLFKAGFCTYQDAEYLCYKILNENASILSNMSKRFSVIMIDECQDLSQSQIRLFYLLKEKGVHFHFIGDINQAIYDFRKVYVDKFTSFIEHQKIQKKILTDNYRSNQQVVDVCGKIINKLTIFSYNINGKEEFKFDDNVLLWEYDNIQELPSKFISILNERGLEISKSVVLGRGHSLLSQIRPYMNSQYDKIELFANALNCWNVPNRTGKDIQNALQQTGKSICYLAYKGRGNHQQQYCPENLSQIEWRTFLFELILAVNVAELHNFEEKTWSEWAGSLKRFLQNYWPKLPDGRQEWDKVKNKIKGDTKNKVVDKIKHVVSTNSNQIRITTIHDVKGETFDAVLLVSAKNKQSKGGHFEQWIGLEAEAKEEHIRFAYVASSRPKHLLVWAIPKKTQNDKNIKCVTDLGFKLK